VASGQELICIRKLTSSDLGWFAVHRPTTASKQRAININADVAQRLLSPSAYLAGGVELTCRCLYPGGEHSGVRPLWKVGKNWRLGGAKLEGEAFRSVRAGDFFILKSPIHNDGNTQIAFTFLTTTGGLDLHDWLMQREPSLKAESMAVVASGGEVFNLLADKLFGAPPTESRGTSSSARLKTITVEVTARPLSPIPPDDELSARPKTLHERLRSPHIMSQMLKVSGDLSAEAQYEFAKVLELLSEQLRDALLAAGMISTIKREHGRFWGEVRGKKIAFVDGGMANLSMLGSTPIAARVGGYIVVPGKNDEDRESFVMVKHLIDELYAPPPAKGGVYAGLFPDTGALRDAARISVEAAGAVHILEEHLDTAFIFLHGALVNPVSRYTDLMEDGQIIAPFPDFSQKAIDVLLPKPDRKRFGRDANFIRVYLRQLDLLRQSDAVVCGVVERESQASSVYRQILKKVIAHTDVPALLPKSPEEWANWFVSSAEQFRITDSLLFRCVLQPGEVLNPVPIDRNELRRAPRAWQTEISQYPLPHVSYLLPTEWGQPVRFELFEKDVPQFGELSRLVMHCAWLLPRYAFPVGLDIVDKYAKVPNWMTRPVNTNTAVQALRRAMDAGDMTTFDALRRMLCGSTRDWLFRPKLT
jgi:hypothetical protein